MLGRFFKDFYQERWRDWLDEWGYLYVRYADDLLYLQKSKRAAERQYERASKYIEGKLKLQINREVLNYFSSGFLFLFFLKLMTLGVGGQ